MWSHSTRRRPIFYFLYLSLQNLIFNFLFNLNSRISTKLAKNFINQLKEQTLNDGKTYKAMKS